MKQIITIILIFFSFNLYSSSADTLKQDSAFIFTFPQALELAKNREAMKKLEKEIVVLEKMNTEKDVIIQKYEMRDSLFQRELELEKEVNAIYEDKLNKFSQITDTYNLLLLSAEERLDLEAKQKRKEKIWKTVYKYTAVAAGGAILFLLITR